MGNNEEIKTIQEKPTESIDVTGSKIIVEGKKKNPFFVGVGKAFQKIGDGIKRGAEFTGQKINQSIENTQL
jgi:hypothetical protein